MEKEARHCSHSVNNKGDFSENNVLDLSDFNTEKTNADSRRQTQSGSLKSFTDQDHRRTFEPH